MDQEVIDAIGDIQLDDSFLNSKFDFISRFLCTFINSSFDRAYPNEGDY